VLSACGSVSLSQLCPVSFYLQRRKSFPLIRTLHDGIPDPWKFGQASTALDLRSLTNPAACLRGLLTYKSGRHIRSSALELTGWYQCPTPSIPKVLMQSHLVAGCTIPTRATEGFRMLIDWPALCMIEHESGPSVRTGASQTGPLASDMTIHSGNQASTQVRKSAGAQLRKPAIMQARLTLSDEWANKRQGDLV